MKATLFAQDGKKKSDLDLPKIFDTKIREDITAKYFEASKKWQAYASYSEAGKRHSASGTISHLRHSWKGHYGKGISRIPRKTMWRRGVQFYWIGAEISGTRGGRKAHPPKGLLNYKKINSKEVEMAMNSAIAATANKKYIIKRYSTLDKLDSAPAVIESLPSKSKDFIITLNNIYGNASHLVLKKKVVRPGIGKLRGRKYKSNAGLLVIKGKEEVVKFKGLDIRTLDDVEISDLYPLGRLTLFTKQAISELNNTQEKTK